MLDERAFLGLVKRTRRRLAASARAGRLLGALTVAAIPVLSVAVFSRFYFVPSLGEILVAIGSAGAAAAVAWALMGRFTLFDGAHFLDRTFDLKERALTTLEILSRGDSTVRTDFEKSVLRETLTRGEEILPEEAVPLRVPASARVLAGLAVVLVVVLFLPNAYGSGARRAEAVYRVSLASMENLGRAGAGLDEKNADLKGSLDDAREALDDSPSEGLKMLVELRKAAAAEVEKRRGREVALDEMNNHPALGELARALEERSSLAAAAEKTFSNLDGAGSEAAAEMRIALKALELALSENDELRKDIERMLESLEEKNSENLARALEEITSSLADSATANKAAADLERTLGAEIRALADAMGEGGTPVASARDGRRGTDEGADREYLGADVRASDGRIESLVEKRRIPPRFKIVLQRYFNDDSFKKEE